MVVALDRDRGISKVLHDAHQDLARKHRLSRLIYIGRDGMADEDRRIRRLELERSVLCNEMDA